MTKNLQTSLCGQTVVLHPERALFWKETRTLVVADPHFGKPQIFRENGIPLPEGTTARDLDRLTALVETFRPQTLLVLGDLLHGRMMDRAKLERRAATWRQRHHRLSLVLVCGNHDQRAGNPPEPFGFDQVVPERIQGPFRFTHAPAAGGRGYGLAGHLHPAVTLTGAGRQKETLLCYWFRKRGAVLPAFGSFTGNQVVQPAAGDRIYVIAESEVLKM